MMIHTVTWDSDAGTHTHFFYSEGSLAAHIKNELRRDWRSMFGDRTEPDDWHEMWEPISERVEYWLVPGSHEIDVTQIGTSDLAGLIDAARSEIERRTKHEQPRGTQPRTVSQRTMGLLAQEFAGDVGSGS